MMYATNAVWKRRVGVLLVLLGALVTASVWGADNSAAAKLATHGDAARGIVPCAPCHGRGGTGGLMATEAGYPHLAGLPAAYLQRQLDAMASGARTNAVMAPIARLMSAEQRRDMALYYASQPVGKAPSSSRAPVARIAAGQALAQHGRWSAKVPACEQCHGRDGVGVGADFPPLAGQPANYIASQLRAWRSHQRSAGPLGLMGAIAGRLGPDDIGAVADYFASLSPSLAERTP